MINIDSLEELEEALADILPPGFHISTDKKGQIIIKSGLRQDDDGCLSPLDSDDEDPDFDPDFEPLDGLEDDD